MPRLNLNEDAIFNEAEPVAQEMQLEAQNGAAPAESTYHDVRLAQQNRYYGGPVASTAGRFNSRSRTLRDEVDPYNQAQIRERLLDLARRTVVAYPGVTRKDETDIINLAKAFESYVLGER